MKHYIEYKNNLFRLADPVSVGRQVIVSPIYKGPQAFGLPVYSSNSFEVDGFTGNIAKGGPCKVDIHQFSPHSQTHIETPSHVTIDGSTIDIIPKALFSGITYLFDLSDLNAEYIMEDHLKFDDEQMFVSSIAIKTSSSLKPHNFDFTGTDPIAPHPDLGKFLSNRNIDVLLLDLPSADKETDGGKLLMHRNFFNLPTIGSKGGSDTNKIIVELAHFGDLSFGYYYYIATPLPVKTDAMITDIWFYKITPTMDLTSSLE